MTYEIWVLSLMVAGLSAYNLYLFHQLQKAQEKITLLQASVLMLQNGMDVPEGLLK